MIYCDYCCGNEASFQLGNGKWCCSSTFHKCPAVRNRMSESAKKKIVTEEHKKHIGDTFRGKKRPEHSELMRGKNNLFYGKTHSEKTKNNFSKKRKEKNERGN